MASESAAILLVGDVLHPVHYLPILLFLDGDVRHGSGRSSAVPVLLVRREPDDVPGTDLFDGAAFALRPTAARGDDERLAKWMGVPCRSRSRLKGDARAL